ncbi:MAG: ElyC/SanA/YdcF family protein [Desulfomonilaceae bacterium]|jgi:uncharacterized SAM-binding protein YcdF (DUF218 family)
MEVFLYFLKRIIAWPFFPIGLTLMPLLSGIALLLIGRTKVGTLLVSSASVIFVVFSLGWTGLSLVKPLEDRAGSHADPEKLRQIGVRNIVVLSKSRIVPALTPADRWFRTLPGIMEGIRLWSAIPEAKLILSGSALSSAEAMAELPTQLGIPKEALILETRAYNTADEARLIAPVLGSEPFALVSSAVHLPRAMFIFKAQGTNPISCPCDFITKGWPPIYLLLVPCVGGLNNSETALHEYYSLFFYWAKAVFLNLGGR